jgi:hypothetical protein
MWREDTRAFLTPSCGCFDVSDAIAKLLLKPHALVAAEF